MSSLMSRILKRIEPRVQVLPVEVKGILLVEENQGERQVPFLVWDLSANGLGIICSDRLIPGEILKLTFGQPSAIQVLCTVVWCELQEADYDFQEPSYRAGLITVEKNGPMQVLIDKVEKSLKDKK